MTASTLRQLLDFTPGLEKILDLSLDQIEVEILDGRGCRVRGRIFQAVTDSTASKCSHCGATSMGLILTAREKL